MIQQILTSPEHVAEFMDGLTKSAIAQAKSGKPVVVELKPKTQEIKRDGVLVDLIYMGLEATIKFGI